MEHYSFPATAIPKGYGAYSHAVVAGDFVFVAGQTARDSKTGLMIPGDVTVQTRRSLEIVEAILAELKLTLADVVRATVYLANVADWDEMNRAYSEIMPAPYPARSTPEAKLPNGALVSIEVTAFRGSR